MPGHEKNYVCLFFIELFKIKRRIIIKTGLPGHFPEKLVVRNKVSIFLAQRKSAVFPDFKKLQQRID